MKNLTIISQYATLAEAVQHSKLEFNVSAYDLDWRIKEADSPIQDMLNRGVTKTERAFICAGEMVPEIWWCYSFKGLRFIRKFNPSFTCVSDSPLVPAVIDTDKSSICFFPELKLSNIPSNRQMMTNWSQANVNFCVLNNG